MLRQAISTPSRAAGSAIRVAARRPIARTQFLQTQLQATRTIAPQRPAARWYSSEPAKEAETKTNGDDAAKTNGQESEVNAIKKQLEDKDLEARDWKVRIIHPSSSTFPPSLKPTQPSPRRTSITAPSPTSATSKSAPSAR